MTHLSIVLASESPRRAEILSRLGIPFQVETSGVNETRIPGEPAKAFVRRAATDKGEAVVRRLEAAGRRPWVLAADTIVVVDGRVLGKPVDADEAGRMLAALSARTHTVQTGVWLGRCGGTALTDVVSTDVTFLPLDRGRIDGYLDSGEWRGKAGAYAIQGLAAAFVARIHGDYFNVMGLPASRVVEMLLASGAIPAFPFP